MFLTPAPAAATVSPAYMPAPGDPISTPGLPRELLLKCEGARGGLSAASEPRPAAAAADDAAERLKPPCWYSCCCCRCWCWLGLLPAPAGAGAVYVRAASPAGAEGSGPNPSSSFARASTEGSSSSGQKPGCIHMKGPAAAPAGLLALLLGSVRMGVACSCCKAPSSRKAFASLASAAAILRSSNSATVVVCGPSPNPNRPARRRHHIQARLETLRSATACDTDTAPCTHHILSNNAVLQPKTHQELLSSSTAAPA